MFPPGSTCLAVLWILLAKLAFQIQDYHLLRFAFPCNSSKLTHTHRSPKPQKYYYFWFGLFPVRSPLLRKSRLIYFPRPTKMFQFRRSPLLCLFIQHKMMMYCTIGLLHSETCGLQSVCDSPQNIATYCVLHRLLMPRYPLCAHKNT